MLLNRVYLFADDITMTAEGVDTYHLVKSANRYKWVWKDVFFRHVAVYWKGYAILNLRQTYFALTFNKLLPVVL